MTLIELTNLAQRGVAAESDFYAGHKLIDELHALNFEVRKQRERKAHFRLVVRNYAAKMAPRLGVVVSGTEMAQPAGDLA